MSKILSRGLFVDKMWRILSEGEMATGFYRFRRVCKGSMRCLRVLMVYIRLFKEFLSH